jgi:hypothetical protein
VQQSVMSLEKPQPWQTADATHAIRDLGSKKNLSLSYTIHSKDRLLERDLLIGDVLYVLKNGFVHNDAEESTKPGFYKYQIETRTPNSGNRFVRLVVIPCVAPPQIKIVTVMWVDE